MHSFLTNQKPNFFPSPDLHEIIPENSIGIEDIRKIQAFLSKKPITSDHNVVVFYDAEKMTIPAQNALLKTLEEPPGNSQIYLITEYPDQLLPTILSRVQITMNKLSDKTIDKKYETLFNQLLSASKVGERIKLLNEANFTRETFLEFLNSLEIMLHIQIQNSQPITMNYELITNLKTYLKSNVNLKLITTHFAFLLLI